MPGGISEIGTYHSDACMRLVAACHRAEIPLRHLRNIAGMKWDGPAGECASRIHGLIGGGFIAVLLGPSGVGKTQIAASLMAHQVFTELGKQVGDRRRQPLYTTANQLFRKLREAFAPESKCSEDEIFQIFGDPALLIIDELHELKLSEFESRRLTELIDQRYHSQKDTVLIANTGRAELGKQLGPSVVSRIHEIGEVVDCSEWPSFRVSRVPRLLEIGGGK